MKHTEKNATCWLIRPQTVASNTTSTAGIVDCKGFRRGTIYLSVYSSSTATTLLKQLDIYETDTETAVFSNMTTLGNAVASLSGATAATTNHEVAIGGALATAAMTGGMEIYIDLTKRKRFLGMRVTGDNTSEGTQTVGAVIVLSDPEESKDSAADKQKVNYVTTAVKSCVQVVKG